MQLNVVLLPEPFGPISPRISPSFTSNDTLLTARSAPKRLVRRETLSMGMEGGFRVRLIPPRVAGRVAAERPGGSLRGPLPHPSARYARSHPPPSGEGQAY